MVESTTGGTVSGLVSLMVNDSRTGRRVSLECRGTPVMTVRVRRYSLFVSNPFRRVYGCFRGSRRSIVDTSYGHQVVTRGKGVP